MRKFCFPTRNCQRRPHSFLRRAILLSFIVKAFFSPKTIGGVHSLPIITLIETTKTVVYPSATALFGQRGKRIRREKRKALQQPTPPRIQTPYGPIRLSYPPRQCDTCNGRGMIRCTVCEGRGVIRATGNFNTKNILPRPENLPQSQWTSVNIRMGHRHHSVIESRRPKGGKKNDTEVRMRNCCGEQQNDFWIPLMELRDKSVWRKGWVTLQDIRDADRGPLRDAKICFRCKGKRVLDCIDCDGKGSIPNYEPLYD